MVTTRITKQDERDLRRSWGHGWREHTAGKSKAVADARNLKSMLKGRGWKIVVFENLGWHYHAVAGSMIISGHEYKGKITYHCLMDERIPPVGGSMNWGDNKHFADPNEAVKATLAEAEKVISLYNDILRINKFIAGIK